MIAGDVSEAKKKYPVETLSAKEQKGLQRYSDFVATGSAYAREHATRPATIGLVLASSPVALLGWIGEKFLAWTDKDPSVDEILDDVTLYWFTNSFPRAIHTYREHSLDGTNTHYVKDLHVSKPLGYSWFPWEILPSPKSWAGETGDLVFFRDHDAVSRSV